MAPTLYERLAAYAGPLQLLRVFTVSLFRTWIQSIITFDLYHLVNPKRLISRSFATGFENARAGFRLGDADLGVPQLVAQAHGTVVEIGAGIGNQVDHFNEAKIKHIYGIEPNKDMIPALRAAADSAGLAGRYTIIPYGVEDEEQLEKAGIKVSAVDCVLSIQVLCSVPNPEKVVAQMYKLLKPGGEMIVLEHLESKDTMSRWVQRECEFYIMLSKYICKGADVDYDIGLYNPFWQIALDGCSLNRKIDAMLVRAGKWDRVELEWNKEHETPTLFPRVWGRLIKAKK